MALVRYEDWQRRLREAVEAARDKPFAWGTHDCLLWACDAVLAMTGHDMGAEHRAKYHDEISAAQWARSLDAGGSLLEIARKAATEVDAEEVSWQQAMRGDVMLINTPLGPALGIVIDHRVAAAGPDGLVFPDARLGIRAWRI